jgi:hypothetical protein
VKKLLSIFAFMKCNLYRYTVVDVDGEPVVVGDAPGGGRVALLLTGVVGLSLAVGVNRFLHARGEGGSGSSTRDGEEAPAGGARPPRAPASRLNNFNKNKAGGGGKNAKARSGGVDLSEPSSSSSGTGADSAGAAGAGAAGVGGGVVGTPEVSPFSTPVRETLSALRATARAAAKAGAPFSPEVGGYTSRIQLRPIACKRLVSTTLEPIK